MDVQRDFLDKLSISKGFITLHSNHKAHDNSPLLIDIHIVII